MKSLIEDNDIIMKVFCFGKRNDFVMKTILVYKFYFYRNQLYMLPIQFSTFRFRWKCLGYFSLLVLGYVTAWPTHYIISTYRHIHWWFWMSYCNTLQGCISLCGTCPPIKPCTRGKCMKDFAQVLGRYGWLMLEEWECICSLTFHSLVESGRRSS